MPCYKPIQGYRSKTTEESGKRKIVFSTQTGYSDQPIEVPCGQCIGCRLERSRQWAMRCVHEATQHQDNCFITLTYNNDNLPENRSLDLEHYQLFMKRLRKHAAKENHKVRYFHCGEYGEKYSRPHYHAILFGYDFPDKKLWKEKAETKLYQSETLAKLWGKGFCSIGDVTFESAAYVARYVLKKITGDEAENHYRYTDELTGESFQITPEYTTMSRNPGIGKSWYDKYKKDAYPKDFVTMRGKKLKPPKYYDSQLERECEESYQRIKANRRMTSRRNKHDQTRERLADRELVKEKQASYLIREIEVTKK